MYDRMSGTSLGIAKGLRSQDHDAGCVLLLEIRIVVYLWIQIEKADSPNSMETQAKTVTARDRKENVINLNLTEEEKKHSTIKDQS